MDKKNIQYIVFIIVDLGIVEKLPLKLQSLL